MVPMKYPTTTTIVPPLRQERNAYAELLALIMRHGLLDRNAIIFVSLVSVVTLALLGWQDAVAVAGVLLALLIPTYLRVARMFGRLLR